MKGNAEELHGLLAEMLTRFDRSNVGISAGYQNQRMSRPRTNGKAEGERQRSQRLG